MSHTRVRTTYSAEGAYGSTKRAVLYCHHNHGSDSTTFYNEKGEVQDMVFESWTKGDDLWDAMMRLWYPYKGDWGRSDLKDEVEYYYNLPDEI